MPNNAPQSPYTLHVGREGEKRLSNLNGIYNDDSRKFLTQAGLADRKSIAEVGCGTGIMTCWIASQIDPKGTVLATDINSEQVKLTQQRAQKEELTNITVQQVAGDTFAPEHQVDFISTRFVLAHVPSPGKIIDAMLRALKPGGTIAIEEAITSGHQCTPPSPIFQRYLEIWSGVRLAQGADPDYGLKLSEELQNRGVQINISQRTSQALPPGQLGLRNIFASNLKEARRHILAHNLSTESELSTGESSTLISKDGVSATPKAD